MSDHSPVYLTTGIKERFLPQLLELINHADQIFMAVAFSKFTGVKLIYPALEDAINAGKWVRILTGDYLCLTDPAALRMFLRLQEQEAFPKPEVRVYESKGQSFHPKAYLFLKMNQEQSEQIMDGCAFVGSSNLSQSALCDGVEWNIRVDMHENPSRFTLLCTAFEEIFDAPQTRPLTEQWIQDYAARRPQMSSTKESNAQTVIEPDENWIPEPTPVQTEALIKLQEARHQGKKRALVVLATGLGKTWLAAFDSKQMQAQKILFVVHREEILKQAEQTFLQMYPNAVTGYYTGQKQDMNAQILFASIQTLGRAEHFQKFEPTTFDYLIVDEFHHAAAVSYRQLLHYFQPQFLLGLTATPERTDNADIYALCDGNLIYQIGVLQGIERALLSPFAYYGIQDKDVDYSRVQWKNGRFDLADLETQILTEKRASHVFEQWQKYCQNKTLVFCASKAHSDYMAAYFQKQGISAVSVHSTSEIRRNEALEGLKTGKYPLLFSVDLFSEGVDVPDIDTVMMLRPTESKILFLQQLGRGLRRSQTQPDKRLHVLDFIGNHKAFLNRPQALFSLGSSREEIRDFIKKLENKELPLPDGCDFHYDLEVLDFYKTWSRGNKLNQVVDLYLLLKDNFGSRPSLLEMYQAGGDKLILDLRQEWKAWFTFLSEQGDLTDSGKFLLKKYYAFFKELEIESMQKSYKMVTLQAMIDLDGFLNPLPLEKLSLYCFDLLCRRSQLYEEIPEWAKPYSASADFTSTSQKKWINHWKVNPIKAWTNNTKKKGQVWFSLNQDRHFQINFQIERKDYQGFCAMAQEILDYRLFRHLPEFEKSEATQNSSAG